MGQLEIVRIPRLILRCFKRITEYFILEPYSFTSTSMQRVNIGICVAGALLLIYIIWKRKIYRDRIRIIFVIIGATLVPLALASIYLLGTEYAGCRYNNVISVFYDICICIGITGEVRRNTRRI